MKKRSIPSIFTIRKCLVIFSSVALLVILKPITGNAQTIVPASLPDQMVAPPGLFGYPNCSSIGYDPFNGGLGPVNPQLTAVVTGIGPSGIPGAPPQLWISDQVSPWLPGPVIPATPFSPTDVAVGNNILVPGQYIIAVVCTAPSGGGNDVFLTLYTTMNTGTGFLAPPLPGPIFNISGTGNVVGAPHIDMVTEYSTLYPAIGGLPRANKFVITWEQSGQGIWAYTATLNAPFPGTLAQINPNNLAHLPDVAGVERRTPSGMYEDWALFTYKMQISAIDLVDDYVTYQEWNMSSNQVWPLQVYDIKPLAPNDLLRIDAADDYNYNNPGPDVYPLAPPAANAYFCIAAATNTNAASDIVEYNNITGPWKATNISTPPGLGGRPNHSPVVACGPGPNYTIAYNCQNFPSPYAPYFATSISWFSGVQNMPGDAYAIPIMPYGPSPVPDGIAIASTCNKDGLGFQEVFPCWQNQNQIWGKYTNTVLYTFKDALGVADITSKDYEIMPNPASDYFILEGPGNTTTQNKYQITDMTGRILQQASINNAQEKVNIRDLACGTYVLSIYNDDQNVGTFKLVKQ